MCFALRYVYRLIKTQKKYKKPLELLLKNKGEARGAFLRWTNRVTQMQVPCRRIRKMKKFQADRIFRNDLSPDIVNMDSTTKSEYSDLFLEEEFRLEPDAAQFEKQREEEEEEYERGLLAYTISLLFESQVDY